MSDVFIKSNRALFERVDDPDCPQGPFSHCTRSLLVDSYLENLRITYKYNGKEENIKGFRLLISEGYFKQAFLLHDQTKHGNFQRALNEFNRQKTEYSKSSIDHLVENVNQFYMSGEIDIRDYLEKNWASFRNLFKFQPLTEIRDYFGEQNAIYFGFVGSFINMLWFPSLVGVLFFILGLSLYYE